MYRMPMAKRQQVPLPSFFVMEDKNFFFDTFSDKEKSSCPKKGGRNFFFFFPKNWGKLLRWREDGEWGCLRPLYPTSYVGVCCTGLISLFLWYYFVKFVIFPKGFTLSCGNLFVFVACKAGSFSRYEAFFIYGYNDFLVQERCCALPAKASCEGKEHASEGPTV